jgi:hypothetical protein
MKRRRPLRFMIEMWRRSVVLADFLAAGSVAVATGVLALITEDAIPLKEAPSLNPYRGAAFVGAVLLLWATIQHRAAVYRNTGTLFYVRTLSFRMWDWHVNAVKLAQRHRMSLRSVTPWVDLSPADGGVIDLIGTCVATSASLNTLINTDRDDTGYTIAPNMIWPVALRVGFELPTVPELKLLDLDGPGTAAGGESLEVTWTLLDSPPEPGVVERTLTISQHSIEDRQYSTERVGLVLAFTRNAPEMDLPGTFRHFGASEYYVIRPCEIRPDLSDLTNVRYDADRLARLAQVLPIAIARIKQDAGDRELVVAALLTKALALAVGWGLAQISCAFFPKTHLALFNGLGKPFLPVRVHPSQTSDNPTHSE